MSEAQKVGSVAIYLHGDDLEPQRLTEFLGVAPDTSWKSGEERRLSSGKIVRAKTGLWTLSTPVTNHDADGAVKILTDTLGENFPRVFSVTGVESAYLDIFVCITQEQSDAGYTLELSNSKLAAIANAGLGLQVTISLDGADDKPTRS
ncbi:DUF4279 domain-containing protein [Rhizobium sp. P38BS-XIX]|uniref:DUF4279 domain-containing protein n=1 Tax=Rhizobium sp. P38BS-XIX TaxID=2726740 RepID=UPI001456464F|nr:DUF4279 domain-containing protein [Rhizobium sp. P38BS-XIX]NLR98624.1 DUF4279 domain-containing protein [Rhizobium sp. P38BS-XIX]